jgi:hypothetical protein
LLDVPALTDGASALLALGLGLGLLPADTPDFFNDAIVDFSAEDETFDTSPPICSIILVNAFIALSHAP